MHRATRRIGQGFCGPNALRSTVRDVLIRDPVHSTAILRQQCASLTNGSQIGYGRDMEQADRVGDWHGTSAGYGLYQRLGQVGLGGLAGGQALAQVGAQAAQLGYAGDDAGLFG